MYQKQLRVNNLILLNIVEVVVLIIFFFKNPSVQAETEMSYRMVVISEDYCAHRALSKGKRKITLAHYIKALFLLATDRQAAMHDGLIVN